MEIEIPFGAFDSELMHQEINIPEGFEATIEGNKIILTKTESEDEQHRKWILEYLYDGLRKSDEQFKDQFKCAIAWFKKQGKHSIYNVPSREVIIAIWDLGNEWKELTNGSISTEYGTQLDYIQKHWHESEYYLREKQGEHNDSDVKDYNSIDPHFGKSIDKIEPNFNFKDGQWIVATGKCVYLITKIDGFNVTLVDVDGNEYVFDTSSLEDAHLWTIDDAKDGDVLSYVTDEEDLWIMIYWSLYEPYEGHVHYHALLVNDNFSDKGTCCICINDLKPATNEQRDLLFQKMKEAGYTFDFVEKELKKIREHHLNS